jgi:hypothetical protein
MLKLTNNTSEYNWNLWPLVPIYPYGQRRTIRKEIIKDTIWTFEQLQGIFYVVVPIRMTVVRLQSGGLLVYAPVAPTQECLQLMAELVSQYGDVKYIILPTASGLEHKVFVGPFARRFPQAQIFVAPGQWSFPINLPLTWLGLPGDRTTILPADSSQTVLAEEFDYLILGPISLGIGKFTEVAFLHRQSRTLLLTDTIISIPLDPPAIARLDPYPLLFHAKDQANDLIEDHPTNYRKGWQRIVLFSLYFQPHALNIRPWGMTWQDAQKAGDRTKQNYFGLYPFQWQENWQYSFELLRDNGRLLVAPILQTLILNRASQETINWVNQVAQWGFQSIIPCHFDVPINTNPQQFRQAFSFLQPSLEPNNLPAIDLQILRRIDEKLSKTRILPPPNLL